MRRIASQPGVLGILAAALLASPTPCLGQEGTPLEGAWVITSWTSPGGDTNVEPQPGLLVFTKTHYSIMFVPGSELRTRWTGEEMTDAEMVAAYTTVIANSGRYDVNANELTTRAFVAKNPNYMGDWPDNEVTYTFEIDGEGRLHLTWGGGPTSAWKAVLRQVDSEPPPW
jgi:hypothetical protein